VASTLALAGDTMLGRAVGERLATNPDAPLIASEVAAHIATADAFVLNLECCISDRGMPFPPGILATRLRVDLALRTGARTRPSEAPVANGLPTMGPRVVNGEWQRDLRVLARGESRATDRLTPLGAGRREPISHPIGWSRRQ
jgi:hypothetical protein